nr:unnamed protein product [Callosobruchus chinensis]
MSGSHMNNEQEHKSPRESGEDSEDESEILEESPCGRWLKRREEVHNYYLVSNPDDDDIFEYDVKYEIFSVIPALVGAKCIRAGHLVFDEVSNCTYIILIISYVKRLELTGAATEPGKILEPKIHGRRSSLLMLYKAQIRPSLENCSHKISGELLSILPGLYLMQSREGQFDSSVNCVFSITGICKKSLRVVLKHRAELTGRSRNCPPSSKTKSSTVCFTFADGGRNLLSSNLNRPLLGRQHSVFLHFTI